MPKKTDKKSESFVRPPVVAVLGHIDHGKSTLLDYIRTANTTSQEVGGITQHISAYEAEINGKTITFIDTPGHEAFAHLRSRGATIADIAILVISAEDAVMDQTKEAIKAIAESGIPYVVAINKIDAPNANVEKTISSLIENEIYLEGHGGDIPFVKISAKTGEGVGDLLDTILLVAELEELTGNPKLHAEGVVIEAHRDNRRGISAILLIKNGHLKTGEFISVPGSFAPTRIMEDFSGKKLKEARFSSPVTVVGWNTLPSSGLKFKVHEKKKDAKTESLNKKDIGRGEEKNLEEVGEGVLMLPIILKADVHGTIEALEHELEKIKTDRIVLKILARGVGNISEADVKLAGGDSNTVIAGFNVKIEPAAKDLADRFDIEIHTSDIIYKLTELIEETATKRIPKRIVEKVTGKGKILKTFGRVKYKQVIGGRVEEGTLGLKNTVRILRRGNHIGSGVILELQDSRVAVDSVGEGREFGVKIESKTEIAPGDVVESVSKVEE